MPIPAGYTSSWTYMDTPFASPATQQSLRDTVRFLIADTDINNQLLTDGEVDGLLTFNTNDPFQAAIGACTFLVAKYSRLVDKSVGDLRLSASQKVKQFTDLIKVIERQAQRFSTPIPYAGGQSISDKEVDQTDDDLVQPNFALGQMDDPGTSPATSSDFNRLTPG